MYILGLTGPLASGKSTVAGILEQEGALILDADKIVHDFYKSGTEENIRIQDMVGVKITNAAGDIDREKLTAVISRTPSLLKKIETYIHPQVRKKYKQLLQENYGTVDIAVIDAPLMFEGGLNTLCDKVAVCTCDLTHRKERALMRPHMTEAKFTLISEKQMNMSNYEERADFLINTSMSILETEHEVIDIMGNIRGELPKAWPVAWENI